MATPTPDLATPTIYAALAAVMADVDHVGKGDWNDHAKFSFRGIDAVVNAVGPALRKHGVIVAPDVVSVDYQVVTTTQNKAQTACRVHVAYTFYGPRGDAIRTTVAGEAWDSGDKATPKAMSVALRTALLQSLALPTDEPDPDASTYERAEPDPLNVAKARAKAAWENGHPGPFEPGALLADIHAQLGIHEAAELTAAQINSYADFLEGANS